MNMDVFTIPFFWAMDVSKHLGVSENVVYP